MANIAQGETECYNCHKNLIKSCSYILYKQSGSALSVYCILHILKCQQNKVLNTLLNKQMCQ